MEQRIFKTGDTVPISGNYQFVKHDPEVADCLPRIGSYLHLYKGMKLPAHDECSQPAVWRLMTVTDEDDDPRIRGI